jgi:hypothetical protein
MGTTQPTPKQVIEGALTGAYQTGFRHRSEGLGEPRPPANEQGRWIYMNGWNEAGRALQACRDFVGNEMRTPDSIRHGDYLTAHGAYEGDI